MVNENYSALIFWVVVLSVAVIYCNKTSKPPIVEFDYYSEVIGEFKISIYNFEILCYDKIRIKTGEIVSTSIDTELINICELCTEPCFDNYGDGGSESRPFN